MTTLGTMLESINEQAWKTWEELVDSMNQYQNPPRCYSEPLRQYNSLPWWSKLWSTPPTIPIEYAKAARCSSQLATAIVLMEESELEAWAEDQPFDVLLLANPSKEIKQLRSYYTHLQQMILNATQASKALNIMR